MPNYTQGSMRVVLQQPDLEAQDNGSIVLDSRRTRPLWFDGRFLAAKDLEREQNYFLQRQADLGQAGGFGVMHGLFVTQPPATGEVSDSETIVIEAGAGITPAGELVMLPTDLTIQLSDLSEEENLDAQFGISTMPQQPARTRTGLYVIALRPVEFTANPITSYPTSIQGSRTTHDGDIVEATAVSLVPYTSTVNTTDPTKQQAMLARQIFVANNPGTLSDSLLPLAMVSLQRGAINWIDPYLVRRDAGPQSSGVRFGLADPAVQQAYLLQYSSQLQSVVASRQSNGQAANFAASSVFQALPSAGTFPIDAINAIDFSQVFFPSQMDVRLSIIPSDELPALIEDSLSLPPIDLTLSADAYANLAVFALIPVPRNMLASLKNSLPETPLNPTLPQVVANRSPLQLLRLFQGSVTFNPVPPFANSAWNLAIGQQKYGFYVRRRSEAIYVDFTSVGLTSSGNPVGFGKSVTFTATVRPSSATGTIQFNDGVNPLGPPVTLSNATASLTVPDSSVGELSVGAHPITAVYSGDDSNAGSTSAALNEIVSDATVTVTSSADPSTLGQSVTFTATVSPNTATGNVQFSDGSTPIGPPVSLTGSAATLVVPSGSISALTIGQHSITAAYSGDVSNAGAASTTLLQTVNQATSTVAIASSASTAPVGQSVTFTATVTGSVTGVAPTGTVQFKDLANVLGTVPLNSGKAVFTTSTLTVGAHTIAAVYGGDANYLSSTSPALIETITAITSGVVVSSSPNPSIFQKPVALTATVTPSTATGTVQFMDGAATLGAAVTIASGRAQLSVTTLTVGSHSITAAYSGDATDTKSTSSPATQVVDPMPTTVLLSAAPSSSALGTTVNLTATVSPNTATGNVQFLDSASSLGTAPLASGTATLKISTLTVGSHTITAAYLGDTNDAPSTSPAVPVTVTQISSTAAVTSSQNPSTIGQSVKFTATVAPASATGTVTFMDGATAIGAAPLSSGTASITDSSLALGTHQITVQYAGDANDAPATSPAVTQQVNQATSTVSLNSSLDPSQFGSVVTFTAAVTPATATGTVQFMDGAANLGAAVPLTSGGGGKAQLPVSNLTLGAHSIKAVYSGDPNNSGSTSNTVTQTVNPATSTVTVTSSAPSSPFGQNVTFTGTVAPTTATGTVQFRDGTAAIGSPATITAGTGKATLSISTLTAGSHSIFALYSGDSNDAASNSPAFTQTITQVPTTTTVASSQSITTFGQSVTFTATVAAPSTATGTVQFKDGASNLDAAVALSGGKAALAVSTLTVGAHSITAAYSGDTNDAASTSPVLTQTVNRAPTTTTVASSSASNTSTFGQAVTFTATVAPSTAAGTVQFKDGGTNLGTAAALAGGKAATPAITTLSVGAHSITAVYSGDANDATSTSAAITQTVNRESSSVTLTSSALNNEITAGQSVTFTAVVTPNAATGTVQFKDGTTNLGAAVALTGGKAATPGITSLTAGTHSITAVYSGDGDDAGSTSNTFTLTVQGVIQ